jgi:thiamine-monophosphate kinase
VLESEFHQWLKKKVPQSKGTLIGIGDDAAVLSSSNRMAVAADMLVEGVHFRPEEASPLEIGAKAVNRNFSDIAAMGLAPHWILVSAALPRGRPEAYIKGVVEGIIQAAERFDVGIIGGDTSRSPGGLVLDVTVLAKIEDLEPILRCGAQAGDRICVTGDLGGAGLGKHLRFAPRVNEGIFLNRNYSPSSMIDLSDGLALDLHRVLDASGKGAIIHGDRIPVSEAARALAKTSGKHPMEHALSDGEDFELLFTLPLEQADRLKKDREYHFSITEIGEVLADPKERTLLTGGSTSVLKRRGYDHQI